MAGTTTTLTAGQVSSGRVSTANTFVDIVNAPAQWSHVEIISYGQGDLFVRLDGVDPAVDGKFASVLPAGAISSRVMAVPSSGATQIRLIASAVTMYVVQQAPDRFY